MFVREKRINGYAYLYLVETVREGGRARQRIIKNLGRKEAVTASGALERLATSVAGGTDRAHGRGGSRRSSARASSLTWLDRLATERGAMEREKAQRQDPAVRAERYVARWTSAGDGASRGNRGSPGDPDDAPEATPREKA